MELWKRQYAEDTESPDGAYTYEIKVKERIGKTWLDWFEGMKIVQQSNVTVLAGEVIDQAALRGILSRVWDLNLTLISVCQVKKVSQEKQIKQRRDIQ